MNENEVMLDILKVNYEDRFQVGGMQRFQKAVITVFPRLLELARKGCEQEWKPIELAPIDGPETLGECCICKNGPQHGISIYRINVKGAKGLWACEQHIKHASETLPDKAVTALVSFIKCRRS